MHVLIFTLLLTKEKYYVIISIKKINEIIIYYENNIFLYLNTFYKHVLKDANIFIIIYSFQKFPLELIFNFNR